VRAAFLELVLKRRGYALLRFTDDVELKLRRTGIDVGWASAKVDESCLRVFSEKALPEDLFEIVAHGDGCRLDEIHRALTSKVVRACNICLSSLSSKLIATEASEASSRRRSHVGAVVLI